MSLFLITSRDQADRIKAAVQRVYGTEIFEVNNESWLVTDVTTTREVSIKLGIRDGVLGSSALVAKVSAYSGWSEPALWNWLNARPEALSDG